MTGKKRPVERCKHCGLRPVYLRLTNGPTLGTEQADGESYVADVDACIAPFVKALNDAGIPTQESCCGHGSPDGGLICLQDGRVLRIQSG